MANVIGDLSSFLKSNGLTGNSMIDTLILTTLVPIIIAYISSIFDTLKQVFTKIITYLWKYAVDKFTNTFLGTILCNMEIYESSPLFNSIKNIIYEKNKYPTECSGKIIDKIINMTNEFSNFEYNNYKKYFATINNDTNKKEDILSITQSYSSDEERIKVFCYKNLYIILKYTRINFKGENHTGNIEKTELKIISFKKNKMNNEELSELIKSFLIDELNINNNMTFIKIMKSYDQKVADYLQYFMTDNFADRNLGLLKYGDGKFDEKIDIGQQTFNTNKLMFNLDTININEMTNIKNHIKINHSELSGGGTFVSLVNKYYDKSVANGISGYYGYFFDDNVLYLISTSPTFVAIISKGKIITEDDIINKLDFIITTGIKNKDNRSIKGEDEQKNQMCLYKYQEKQWNKYTLDKREFDTVYLPTKLLDDVRKEMNNFFTLNKLYLDCSIPYRKGILLYGPPGTGKTSLVKTLAYEYQLDIYTININDDTINDDSINNILNSISSKKNKILLFEDIDTAFADKEKIKNETKAEVIKIDNKDKNENKNIDRSAKFLTYSGLLNALDGVLTNHYGVITIMTTNYIEKLGDAFLRPGRIDRKFLLKECNKEQIIKMTNNILDKYFKISGESVDKKMLEGKINDFADKLLNRQEFSNVTPSKLQVYLLRYVQNIDDIFNNYKELL